MSSISDDSDNSEFDNNSFQELSSNGYQVCRGCKKEIYDKYYLKVNEYSWHEECLKCDTCSLALVSEETCFIKKNKIFCKLDYYKNFGIKCAKCARNIQSSDWVRRARENVYHLACFACESCKRQLSTGEEFALQNNKLLCKTHYCESIDGESGENSRSKNKRVRTTFTEEQLQVLQANFDVDSNPDGQDLERIAQITGLSKRVTQVWFQNSRARQKKYKEKKNDLNCTLDLNDVSNEDLWNDIDLNSNSTLTNSTTNTPNSTNKKKQQNHSQTQQQYQQNQPTFHHLSTINQFSQNNCYNPNVNNGSQIKAKKNSKNFNRRNKNHSNNLDNELHLSWASDNSICEGDENETSMYDSSLEYNQTD